MVLLKASSLVRKGEFTGLLIKGDFNQREIQSSESQGNLLSNCLKHWEFLESVEESGFIRTFHLKLFN